MNRPEHEAGESPGLYRNTGTCADAYGDQIEVGTIGDVVTVIFHLPSGTYIGMHMHAEQREQFQRLFMEAERQAEAHAEAPLRAAMSGGQRVENAVHRLLGLPDGF